EICSKLPRGRQTLLFSATMPPPIKKLADKFLNDPKTIEVARPATANVNIEQKLVLVAGPKKRDAVRHILREPGFRNAIIFCNRKVTVREVYTSLKRSNFSVGQIQGDMDQSSRIAEFDRFKKDEIHILVASDVAARGLDVKGVSHVINFDVPWQPDDYIHRIGRTGRAGMTGIAYTLATPADAEAVANIEKLTGLKLPRTGAGDTAPAAAEAEEVQAEAPRRDRPKPAPKPARETRHPEPKPEARRPERRPEPKRPAAKPAPRPVAEVEDDDSWNGPMPGFLSVGFTPPSD
ncbi:MAG: DEAD/DEAH box helicase, partial [Sphingomonas bacterium]|nr:DEAD/DEAH box helicase [Sphingomonas bacterium]